MVLQCRRSKRGMAIAAVNNHMECACMVSVSMIYICAPTAKGYTGVLNGPGVEYPNMEPATWYLFYYTPLVGTWARVLRANIGTIMRPIVLVVSLDRINTCATPPKSTGCNKIQKSFTISTTSFTSYQHHIVCNSSR